MTPAVCVIIITWNGLEDTVACLETVYDQTYDNLHVIVVDNGSDDGTFEQVAEKFPETELIQLPENIGAVRGYNVGFRRALESDYPYLFLLNNDTLLAPDCIAELVKEAESAPDVGLVMPKIYYADEPKLIWSVGTRANPLNLEIVQLGYNEVDEGQWREPTDIDDAPFCAVLMKRTMMDDVGLPDEIFYFYYEDMDYCLRARRRGYRLRLAPAATMWHKVSSSSGGSDTPRERYWMARSGVLYFRKHAHFWQWPIILFWRTGSATRTTMRLLRKRRMDSLKAYWRGLWHGIREKL
ncbi:MAG: glycosyltransferase family 2 protein [Chloroflexota bacterium]